MRSMTAEEWEAYLEKFYFLKIKLPDSLLEMKLEIINKWLILNTKHRWYWNKPVSNSQIFIFENNQDRMFFKLWISSNILEGDAGLVEEIEREIAE